MLRFFTALLLALITWGWVVQATDPINTTEYAEVEIALPDIGDELVIVTNLPRGSIEVEGPRSETAKINRALLGLQLDISSINGPGQYRLPIVVDAPDTSSRISVEPNYVQVQVDEVTSRVLPIEIEESNTENATRVINTITTDVSQVTVSGPSSAVDRVENVILPVTVDTQSSSFSEAFTPYAVDINGQRVSEVTVRPSQIMTRVELQSRGREVSVISNIVGEPADGYVSQQRTVLPNSIVVEGPAEALDDLLFVNTEPVDISGASQSVSERVGLADLPEGVSVIEPSDGQVEVRVAIEDSSSTMQTLTDLPVSALNVPEGYEAVIEPETVDATVEGSVSALSTMTSEDITIIVDLRGLTAGSHTLEPVVALQNNGVRSSGTNPETVQVTIRTRPPSTPVPAPTSERLTTTPQAIVSRSRSLNCIALIIEEES